MSPPVTPGIPGLELPPKERRPRATNPPPRELADSLTNEVRAGYGSASFAGPAWVFVAVSFIVLTGLVVYFASRRQPEDPTGIAHDVRDELSRQTEEMQRLRSALTDRVDKMETRLGVVEDSQVGLRKRVAEIEGRNP